MNKKHWCPTIIKRVEKCDIVSSTSPVIVMTDKGRGYFKALGNREGPQVLACEYVGTSLACLLEIPTFDYCILLHNGIPEIRLNDGRIADCGPGFITKEELGGVWDGEKKTLEKINNREDITRLVCLDTWVRNQDRYFPGKKGKSRRNLSNVFISKTAENHLTLKAFDFTHAFTNARDVTPSIVQDVRDDSVYGLFPEFKDFLDKETAIQMCDKLKSIKEKKIRPILDQIPKEWEINTTTREAWITFLLSRAVFLSENFISMIGIQHETKQELLSFDEEQ